MKAIFVKPALAGREGGDQTDFFGSIQRFDLLTEQQLRLVQDETIQRGVAKLLLETL